MKCPICNRELNCIGKCFDGTEIYHCPEHGSINLMPDPWRDFRKEASMHILQGIVAGKVYRAFPGDDDWSVDEKIQDKSAKRAAYTAVKYADALIELLKEMEC